MATGAPVETCALACSQRFVVKTQDLESGRKVFINLCGHSKVAAPGNWSGEEVASAAVRVCTRVYECVCITAYVCVQVCVRVHVCKCACCVLATAG